jgi:hypothetical protein
MELVEKEVQSKYNIRGVIKQRYQCVTFQSAVIYSLYEPIQRITFYWHGKDKKISKMRINKGNLGRSTIIIYWYCICLIWWIIDV